MSTQTERLASIRLGGAVERCHGIPHQGSYSNAKHQWGVAVLMYVLWPEDYPRLSLHCLTHDVPEAWIGDIPAPMGRWVPGLNDKVGEFEDKIFDSLGLPLEGELSPEDHQKVKACDRLELYVWCLEEQMRGNLYASECRTELESYFAIVPLPPAAQTLLLELQASYGPGRQSGVIRGMVEE